MEQREYKNTVIQKQRASLSGCNIKLRKTGLSYFNPK